MEQAVFALILMGCSHNLDVCEPVEQSFTAYKTEIACDDAVSRKIRLIDDFPMAIAECRKVDAQILESASKRSKLAESLRASIAPEVEMDLASSI